MRQLLEVMVRAFPAFSILEVLSADGANLTFLVVSETSPSQADGDMVLVVFDFTEPLATRAPSP